MTTHSFYLSAGVQAGAFTQHADELHSVIGQSMFVLAGSWAQKRARAEFRRAVRRAYTDASKDAKRAVTNWLVINRILDTLVRRERASLPKWARASLMAPGVSAEWRLFSLLATWRLKEYSTKRVSIHEFSPRQLPKVQDLRRRRRAPDAEIQAAMQGYVARRRDPKDAPESQRNDRFGRVHTAVCNVMAAAHQTASIASEFVSVAVPQIQEKGWAPHRQFFVAMPNQQLLAIVLALLLRVRLEHNVVAFDHADVNKLIRVTVAASQRAGMSQWLDGQSTQESLAFRQEVARAIEFNCRHSLESELGLGGADSERESIRRLVDALEPGFAHGSGKAVRALLAEPSRNEYEKQSSHFWERWECRSMELFRQKTPRRTRVRASFYNALRSTRVGERGRLPSWLLPKNADVWERIHWRRPRGHSGGTQLLQAALAAVPEEEHGEVTALVEANLGAAINTTLAEMTVTRSYDVALVLASVSADHAVARAVSSSGPALTRLGELTWDIRVPGPRLPRETVVLVCPNVEGTSPASAVRTAREQARPLCDMVWAMGDKRMPFSFYEHSVVRDNAMDVAVWNYQCRSSEFPQWPLSFEDFDGMMYNCEHAVSRVEQSTPAQSRIWRRISAASGALRDAREACDRHQKYLNLWVCLEGLLSKLPGDNTVYERHVPIGQRVAYRASLLSSPTPEFSGMTYGDFRWAKAIELQSLYEIRNRAMHRGLRDPPFDSALFSRMERVCVVVLKTLLVNSLWYGLDNIEEILALCEYRHPAADTIP